jgi:hypothetical protein
MNVRFYMLISLVLMWFFFGTLMILRGSTDLNELTEFEGILTDIGTTETTDLKGEIGGYFGLTMPVISVLWCH